MSKENTTQLATLIGTKPGNLSQIMHNAAYQYLGLNYRYIALDISGIDGLEAAVNWMRATLNFRGSSVTMPYKKDIMRHLERIDPVALEIDAINTIVKEGRALAGYNTDWIGAMEALKEETELEGKTAAVAGAGGAANAIVYVLKQDNANVIVFNRNVARAEELAKKFGLEVGGSLDDIANLRDYDILINATPVGAYPNVNESIVSEKALKEGKVVMDIVSKPSETKLLKMAQDRGCKIIPGYKMLVYQAVPQVELFTGREVTRDVRKVMERAVVEALK